MDKMARRQQTVPAATILMVAKNQASVLLVDAATAILCSSFKLEIIIPLDVPRLQDAFSFIAVQTRIFPMQVLMVAAW